MTKIKQIVKSYIKGAATIDYTVKYTTGTVRTYNANTVKKGIRDSHAKFIENANVTHVYDTVTGDHILDIYE